MLAVQEALSLMAGFPGVACAHMLEELHASRYAIGRHTLCINMKKASAPEVLLGAMFGEE